MILVFFNPLISVTHATNCRREYKVRNAHIHMQAQAVLFEAQMC